MKDRIKLYILSLLTFIWFSILNYLTFQNGEGTSKTSGGMTNIFSEFIQRIFHITIDTSGFERSLRFAAHPISFLILTVLLLLTVNEALRLSVLKNKKATIIALLFLITWSLLCEILKISIPGRHCDIPDAAGNLAGVATGFILILFMEHIFPTDGPEKSGQ